MKLILKDAVEKCAAFTRPYRVCDGKKFRLSDYDPGDTGILSKKSKGDAELHLKLGVMAIADLQERLYADASWSLLMVLQAMDAAGKDGIIKHVFSGVNPQGCKVVSFKSPSSSELRHDYLWRCARELPERGCIGIFNRSYYEEVLSVRVHPEFLNAQNLPDKLVHKDIWKERYEDIASFERYLTHNGIIPVKIFLNLSKGEQRKRFLSRLEEKEKNWKFSPADLRERSHWDAYQTAIEDMVRHTSSKEAPWYVVPADNKWYARIVVMAALVETLAKMNPEFPGVDKETLRELNRAEKELEAEVPGGKKKKSAGGR